MQIGDEKRIVVLRTSMGSIEIELFWEEAPQASRNFYELSKSGYYNNCLFHRVEPEFVIQTGDPTGTGRGGKSIYQDAGFPQEIHPLRKHASAGIVSTAARFPALNGSQFFITLKEAPYLDGLHTVFGKVINGMDVVQRIGVVQIDKMCRPKADVSITSCSFPLEDKSEIDALAASLGINFDK